MFQGDIDDMVVIFFIYSDSLHKLRHKGRRTTRTKR